MPPLLSCESISKSYDGRPLFRDISFGIPEGEKLALIGPNGSGKSTLLKILANLERPDSGVVSRRRLARVGYVSQEDLFEPELSVEQVLLEVAKDLPLDEFERAALVGVELGKAGFGDRDQKVRELSGGWRKRLAIARELVQSPDLLLMDEPTNHLDLDGILWLQKLLSSGLFAFVVVSHDRYFLENVADRVMELNRCYPDGFFSVSGAYSDFIIKREEFLHAQSEWESTLANQVRREVEWLQRGARARTTKSIHRIREAGRMMDDLAELRIRNSQDKRVGIDFDATRRRSKELLVARDVEKHMGGRLLFRRLSFVLSPGVKLGLLGPNGSGKTTLLRILNGDVLPDSGSVKRADGLRIVLFDQEREQVNRDISLKKALAGDSDTVAYRDQRIHISSWAKRFLFHPEQLNVSVGSLSGGEQARILIAQLMLRPADVLILDEPTNDLDIPSLEVLEESLTDFPGAVVLVTHDRYMLDRVSTEILAIDGAGSSRFFADCAQWESVREEEARTKPVPSREQRPAGPSEPPHQPAQVGLTGAEKRELNEIEAQITAAEKKLAACLQSLENPAVIADHIKLHETSEAADAAQQRVDWLYARWEELEAKRGF